MELGNLSPELIEEIFSLVPLKCRTRLKSVAKNWCDFISRLRRSTPLTTSSGLVVFLKEKHSSDFIQLRDQTLGQNPILLASFLHNFPYLVDSCNGLLLYGTNVDDFWTYHVSSPFLNQAISLPRAHAVSRSDCTSLMFDGSRFDQFRVICFFRDEIDYAAKTIKYTIFSPKSWDWREYEARIVNSDLLLEGGFIPGQCFRPSVYCRGKVYWIWSFCLLIYDDEGRFFKLIRLPTSNESAEKINNNNNNNNVHLSQLLWESEGRINFCDPADEGFYIWEYVDDEEGHEFMDYNWRCKRFIELDEFVYAVTGTMKLPVGWSRKRIQPVAFNEDLQLLYFKVLAGTVVSYSFETQRLETVWSIGEQGDTYSPCNVFPFQFNSFG